MTNENPPIRIPEDEEGAAEIASEGEDESGVSEKQLRNLAETQARIADI